jgi:hypothetical protein
MQAKGLSLLYLHNVEFIALKAQVTVKTFQIQPFHAFQQTTVQLWILGLAMNIFGLA